MHKDCLRLYLFRAVLCYELWGAELNTTTKVTYPLPPVPEYVCGSVQGFKQHTKTRSKEQENNNKYVFDILYVSHIFAYSHMSSWLVYFDSTVPHLTKKFVSNRKLVWCCGHETYSLTHPTTLGWGQWILVPQLRWKILKWSLRHDLNYVSMLLDSHHSDLHQERRAWQGRGSWKGEGGIYIVSLPSNRGVTSS